MLLVVLIIISIITQLFAAVVAAKLTRTTKYNSAWILITIGLLLTTVLMIGQFFRIYGRFNGNFAQIQFSENLTTTIIVIISLSFAVGVFMIEKVLKYIATREEKRRKSEELVLSMIIKAEEDQRKLLAKELHDGLGPLLSTAKLSVSALKKRYKEGDIDTIIKNIDQAISLSIISIKDISNNLSPHILNNFGIIRALTNFINRIRPAVSTNIIFNSNLRGERFDSDSETTIYRITCELITNVLKHAEADTLAISIQYANGRIAIDVNDNGKGFDTKQKSEGMGLGNISSRVNSMKGHMKLKSSPDSGTQISLSIPVTIVNNPE